jgi:hypothetical protein
MYSCYDLYVDTSGELEQKRIKSKKIPAACFILPPPSTVDVFLLS